MDHEARFFNTVFNLTDTTLLIIIVVAAIVVFGFIGLIIWIFRDDENIFYNVFQNPDKRIGAVKWNTVTRKHDEAKGVHVATRFEVLFLWSLVIPWWIFWGWQLLKESAHFVGSFRNPNLPADTSIVADAMTAFVLIIVLPLTWGILVHIWATKQRKRKKELPEDRRCKKAEKKKRRRIRDWSRPALPPRASGGRKFVGRIVFWAGFVGLPLAIVISGVTWWLS